MDFHGYLLPNFRFWPGSPALAIGVGRLEAWLVNAGVLAAPAGGCGGSLARGQLPKGG